MREYMALESLDNTKLMVHDKHSASLLDTRKPDFVFKKQL
jgi:hypothetical protein